MSVRNTFLTGVVGCALATVLVAPVASAAPSNFIGFNTLVNGYQDEFDSGTLAGKGWTNVGTNVFTQDTAAGVLHVGAGAPQDPVKLLYSGTAAYNNTVQDVLLRIKVTNFGTTDGDRGGPSVASDATSGQGVNFQFRDLGAGRSLVFLDDTRNRADAINPFAFTNNTYYWMRIVHNPAADASGAEAQAKIWLADGVTPEPAAVQASYDYTGDPTKIRSGLAGIGATVSGSGATFDVDYILVRAAGLPQITAGVTPEPGTVGLLGVVAGGVLAWRRRA